jgi:HrpA-like RNA helicase
MVTSLFMAISALKSNTSQVALKGASTFCIMLLAQVNAACVPCNLGELTKLGRRMAEFPLDPQLARTLLASETYGVAEQVGP